jgi:hypothetical protein
MLTMNASRAEVNILSVKVSGEIYKTPR